MAAFQFSNVLNTSSCDRHAALMLGSGATLTYVRDQMGPKSIQVTANVYGRFIPAGNRSAVDALGRCDATKRNRRAKLKSWNCGKVVVSLNFASWNRVNDFLRRLEDLRTAA